MNNRNCKPSLRLVDGGPSPWSIKGMLRAATAPAAPAETITQKYARQDAERAAKAAAAAPAPVAAPAPGAGLAGYVGNTALQAREKAAGLRDGGEVPGSGRGDKVPALYEPGEFVVSNDMLDAQPGLREGLHTLRGNVLATQGKTVAQADAEAYDDGSTGESHERVSEGSEGRMGEHEGRHVGAHGAQGDDPRRRPGLRSLDQVTLRANQGFGFSEDFLKKASDAIGERFNPTQPPNGRYGAPPNPPLNSAVQPAAPAAQPGPRPSLRAGVGSQTGVAQKSLYAGGRAAGGLTKLVGALGPAAAGADVVSHFNDYKINDPEVDSSNAGTFGALAKGDFSGAGRSFSKGALEAGMDLGSFAANTLDYVVPGKAPVSTAYDSMLRRQFGDQLQAHPSVSSQADAARATTAQPTNTPSLRNPTAQTYSGPMGPQINPDAPSLRGRPGADVAGAPGVGKFTENGRTLYSNVAGDNAAMLDKRQVGIVPGMSQGLINQTLTNPDGSRWSANDNAIMAANLRDGIDPYRGTSRQKGEDEAAQLKGMRELAFSKPGTPGRRSAMKMFAEQQQQQTLRQGQDLKYKGDVYNADMTAALAQLKARADAAKDQRDFAVSRYDKGLEQGAKMDEQGRAAFKNKFDTLDKDGKPIARPDMEAAANELVMRQNPNWSQLPQRERAQLQSDAFDHISLVGNLRDHQNNSIWQSIGLKDADVRADHLPDLKGARVEETGFIEGKVTPNASSGDYKITTRDGKTMYLGRDKVTEDQLSYLKRNGAKFGNQ